ncbi:hypothetical protein KA082_01390 [Candidatus Woesebacteria bacterium]|nr:hypothetical protein [Candidatus Woesebacteria bacterium]
MQDLQISLEPIQQSENAHVFVPKKKNTLVLGVVGLTVGIVALAGLFTSLWMAQQPKDIRSEASADVQTSFTFGKPTQSVAQAAQGVNTVSVNTGTRKLSAATIAITYDPQYIQVLSIEKTAKLPLILATAQIDNTKGTASITVGSNPTESPLGTFDIATITFKALKSTSGTVMKYDSTQLQAAILDQNTNAAAVAGNATITITGGTSPTAEVTLPSATCSAVAGKFKEGTPITFTEKVTTGSPAANETGIFIAKVDAAGTSLVKQGETGATCLDGAGAITGALGVWCKIGSSTVGSTGFTGTITWSKPIIGKYVVTVNAMVPNGTSCSGNPTCEYSTDSPFINKTSCGGFTNCSSNDWHTFEVVAASSCVTQQTLGAASVDLSFKLQGLKKAGIKQTAAIQVKYVPNGQTAAVTKTYSKEFTSDATGVLKASTPLALSDISIATGSPITGAKIYVKVPTSLTKLVGTVTLTANQKTTLASSVVLPVGDFKREPAAEANMLKFNDLALAITEFKQLENPVNDANRTYDVNFDGKFNLQDFAIVLVNFDQLEYSGEHP